ncbi:pyridoxal-phosphate dependent enzyme [Sphingomonas suaedae]|uniref:Pyridoxal-phosphate dependent enzyme n=1 Tax=Sphingomonas suaedae TaxID=2599297 RepID=A0A518RLF1_9SPHN|nr:pyridoxal-phosphate dependent enzyme [Sphingomonas suaedae]QDX28278.1 pyridoxal-phosphate dependent enzyme [Sphingomonas suaedae]
MIDSATRRAWVARACAFLTAERMRAAQTPLLQFTVAAFPNVRFYLKDERAHPSGSLKHRLAHALFAHAICSGNVGSDTLVVEASSGSTAISEAWFARALGLHFVAVVPDRTAPAKLAAIRAVGGEILLVPDGGDVCAEADALAKCRGGWFMNQFDHALEATDWRGANNIAESLFGQLIDIGDPVPRWVVTGAGTGGTSATIGRYIRHRPELAEVRMCVVDPAGSAFYKAYVSGDRSVRGCTSPVVEGIGRGRVERGFLPALVDRMIAVPDASSIAAAYWLRAQSGAAFGPSTGTNMVGAILLAQELEDQGESGAIAVIGCDGGERYRETIYDSAWLQRHGYDISGWDRLPDLIARHANLMHSCRTA